MKDGIEPLKCLCGKDVVVKRLVFEKEDILAVEIPYSLSFVHYEEFSNKLEEYFSHSKKVIVVENCKLSKLRRE